MKWFSGFSFSTCLIFALIIPLLLSIAVHGASTGLSPGLWARYTISGSESQNTTDALFTVQSISGANVTFAEVDTFADGHQTTDTVLVSTSTGPTIPASGQYFVISPQKPIGESVYPGDYHYQNLPIQDITSRSYASATRQVSHVRAENSSQVCINPPCTNQPKTFEDFYWDSSSGIFTEISKTLNGTVMLHVVMSTTSVWQPANSLDSFLIPSAIASISTAAIIAVLVLARYRRRVKIRR